MGKTVKVIEQRFDEALMQTKVGHIAIFKGTDYGSRLVDADNPALFESEQECNDVYEGNTDFVAVAKVTWEELA